LAKNWYLKFVAPGTAAKFINKSSLLLMSPNLYGRAENKSQIAKQKLMLRFIAPVFSQTFCWWQFALFY
jgi:hypothetical protein